MFDEDRKLVYIPRNKNEIVKFCPECGGLMRNSVYQHIRHFRCRCGYYEDINDNNSEFENSKVLNQDYDPKDGYEFQNWKDEYLKSELENFRCPECGSSKALVKHRHMRCLSKSTNIFIECLNCRKLLRIENQ